MAEEKNISYPYLIKRALKITIEFVIILIIIFFLPEIISFFQFLYGF